MRLYYRKRGSPWGLSLPWWLAIPAFLIWLVGATVVLSWELLKVLGKLIVGGALLLWAGGASLVALIAFGVLAIQEGGISQARASVREAESRSVGASEPSTLPPAADTTMEAAHLGQWSPAREEPDEAPAIVSEYILRYLQHELPPEPIPKDVMTYLRLTNPLLARDMKRAQELARVKAALSRNPDDVQE